MFDKSFEANIDKVELNRVSDEDGGDIHFKVKFTIPTLPAEMLEQLGPEIVALVEARKESEASKAVPFKKATLDMVYDDVSLVFYGLSASDSDPIVKMQVDECKVKGLVLKRNEGDQTKVDLSWKMTVPPLKKKDRDLLIDNSGQTVKIAITYRQTSLL